MSVASIFDRRIVRSTDQQLELCGLGGNVSRSAQMGPVNIVFAFFN
jgi:hypothetical protein